VNKVSPRQNPFSKIQSLFERVMDRITAVGPGELEPAEIAHKLANAMEDNLQLQAGGIRLAPNFYDIYLSIEDHRRLSSGQSILIEGWRKGLEDIARQRHYVLRTSPVIRLHPDSKLRRKIVHVLAELKDAQHMGGSEDGIMATKEISAQDMQRARSMLEQSQAGARPLPGVAPQQSIANPAGGRSGSFNMASAQNIPIPTAWLTIRLPQAGQQIYRIEKPEINIGRQRSNDIIVEDKRVSRLHAKILYQNGQFTIFDLGSVNGIAVNGTPHVKQHTLHSGDRFTVGSYDFYFDERR
jgi:Protein of unknown function (DUF3662)/FHA domain